MCVCVRLQTMRAYVDVRAGLEHVASMLVQLPLPPGQLPVPMSEDTLGDVLAQSHQRLAAALKVCARACACVCMHMHGHALACECASFDALCACACSSLCVHVCVCACACCTCVCAHVTVKALCFTLPFR